MAAIISEVRSLEWTVSTEKIKHGRLKTNSEKFNVVSPAAFSYVKIYFDYLYFTATGPFRFVYSGNCYIMKTNRMQKIIYYLLQTFLLIYGPYKFIKSLGYQDVNLKKDPMILCEIFIEIIILLYIPVWNFVMWKKKQHFNQLMKLYQNWLEGYSKLQISSGGGLNINYKENILLHIFLILLLTFNLVCMIIIEFGLTSLNNGACKIIFIHNDVEAIKINGTYTNYENDNCWTNTASIGVRLLHITYKNICAFYLEMFTFIAAIAFWKVAVEFKTAFELENSSNNELLIHYEFVKEFVRNLNEGISKFILLSLLSGIPFYSDTIIVAYNCRNWLSLLYFFVFGLCQIFMVIFAADAHEKVNGYKKVIMRRWYKQQRQNSSSICVEQLSNNLFNLHNCEEKIALSGGGLFNIHLIIQLELELDCLQLM